MMGQPDPVKNGGTPIYQMVRTDLMGRAEMGRAQYGTYLQAHNGRDALTDAYEEVLDLACYLRQLIEEDRTRARA